jgi:hypothetical protein
MKQGEALPVYGSRRAVGQTSILARFANDVG